MLGLPKNPVHYRKERKPFFSAPPSATARHPAGWRGKGLLRLLLLLLSAALVAAVAANFGIARDYGYLRASVLTGAAGGYYHTLATRLADRAKRGHGTLSVIPTAGSIENVSRLTGGQTALHRDVRPDPGRHAGVGRCAARAPRPAARAGICCCCWEDRATPFTHSRILRGASIGVGPQGSGTAYLMHQLFQDSDLRAARYQAVIPRAAEQTRLVAQGKLDLAAVVMQENAEFLHNVIRQDGLDIVAPATFRAWSRATRGSAWAASLPVVTTWFAHSRRPTSKWRGSSTLVVASPCAQRADRIALLMLLGAELPGFVRANPPGSTSSATVLPLAHESAAILQER